MPNENGVKEEGHELQDRERDLEEKLLSAKDATLRLWERNRHLQERMNYLETRLKVVIWLVGALCVSGGGLFGFIAWRQLSLAPNHLTELQAVIGPLRERVDRLDLALETQEGKLREVAETSPGVLQTETELMETIQKRAPEMLAAALGNALHIDSSGNIGVGTAKPAAPFHVAGTLLGAAKGENGEALRVVAGATEPKATAWKRYSEGGIYVDVDTSSAGFSSTPYYFTSLGGHTNSWLAQGTTSIYRPTAQGFRVHVSYPELTVAQAKDWGWHITWLAVGN